ncbi:MAG: hypothetical protein IJ104_07500 [Methanobrevibacter sp.]|nr:hypothetical protein [Methanobrevibacter sp.]
MPSENQIRIMLIADDKFSEQAQKVDDQIKKFGDHATQSNNKAAQSAEKANQKYVSTSYSINRVGNAVRKVGTDGAQSFNNLSESTQKAVINVNRLDESTQKTIKYMSTLSDSSRKWFIENHAHAQEAIAKFDALQNETRNWGNTLDYTRSKMQLMGTDVDSIKGKVQVVGSSIKTYMGNSWDTAKNKVTVFGDYIKTHVSNALTTVKNKIQSLGDAFGGLGGVISSVFGGIGLSAMADMTIGASISRDRIYSLSQAILGAGQSTEKFDALWKKMDSDTNASLVSLDQLSQSMSVVKQMTGATGDQLYSFEGILLDIGQRAILMGKSGDEAMGLMQAAGKGLNGEFEMLKDNFGITRDKLEELGWTGAADDIDGYTNALQQLLNQSGDVSNMMDTTYGKLTSLKKMWSVSARSLGDDFKPMVDAALDSVLKFVDANNDGKVDAGAKGWLKYAAGAMTAASAFATLAPSISPVLQCLDMFWSKGRALLTFLGLLEAEEGALTLSTLANTIATKANSIAQAARGVETAALSGEEVALAATTAGLTAEEIAAAAAHSANGIAMEAEGIAAVGAAAGTTSLTGALSAMFMALLTNPLTWVVVALVALAVAVYEVGKAFGWWKDIPTMMQAVWAGIQRLWDAFIHHPDVQSTIQAITDAWNWLCWAMGQAKKYVEDFFDANINGEFDVVHALIEGIGVAWQVLSFPIRAVISIIQFLIPVFQAVASAVQTAQSKFGAFGGFLAGMGAPIIFVYELLKKIVCILLGCSPGIVPALEKVWEVFTTVWNAISSFIGSIVSPIVEAIRPIIDIFVEIVEYLMEMFLPVWNLLSDILTVIWNNVNLVIQVFELFLNGQITLPQMLTMIWTLIQMAYITILTMIINFVLQWAGQLISAAINAASGFVNGIVTWISSLPSRVWNYLSQTTQRVISAGSQWVNSAKQKAGEMVNGAVTNVQGLPGKIYNEFSKIPGKIQEAAVNAVKAAADFGKRIIDAVLNSMGIHSPGIVQNSIATEFKNTFLKIKDAIKPAGEYAKQVGENIVEKFGNPKLSLDTEELMPYYDLDADPLENFDFGELENSLGDFDFDLAELDLSGLSGGLGESTALTEDTNTMIGDSYTALAAMMMGSLNDMVLQDQLAYGQIQANDIGTFNAISTSLNLNLLSMGTMLRTQLTLMLNTHRNAMTSANNTTRTQLAGMLLQTEKVTGEMRSAWSVMANSIISAAGRIKNEATTYFNQLSTTIGTFYKKLQNPSQWGAGGSTGSPRTTRHVGRDPSIMGRMTGAMAKALRRDNQAPSFISVSSAQRNPFINNSFVDYFNLKPSSRVKTEDLIEGGYIDELHIPLLAKLRGAGWDDVVSPNVSHIKNKAREWQMRGPQLLGYIDSGMAFKVKEFENGRPKISFDSFRKMAEALFSTITYDFYYDSDKTGSWVTALQTGSVNCSDGADALIALAHTCGLSAYKQHGHWNQFGHFYAMVEGHKMDTTGWQQRRTWTPSASAGPTPKNPLEQFVVDLKEIFTNDSSNNEIVNESTVEEIKLTLEHNVNVNVEGNTETVDTDALIAELTASVTDKRLIDRIADALIKRDKRIARMGGA